jgi:NOL1/NOP2/fmu family ribosome biogenesis protein
MVQQLKILNSKETKEIRELLLQQYGYEDKMDVVFMLSEKKQRIYLFTRDLVDFDLSRLRVDSMGLYFGTLFEGKIRLTIEGTQMIGSQCTKNVLEISKREMQVWLQGEKLELSKLDTSQAAESGEYVILRHGLDYLGCGKIGGNLILNYIPKTRYISAIFDDAPDTPIGSSERSDDVPNAAEWQDAESRTE